MIDALDELPEATQQVLRRAVSDARPGGDGEPASAGVSFVLTARPGAPALPGACLISVAAPGDDVIGAYLRRRGISDEHITLLVKKADGNWLHAYLLAEQAVRPGFDPGQLPVGLHPSLAKSYARQVSPRALGIVTGGKPSCVRSLQCAPPRVSGRCCRCRWPSQPLPASAAPVPPLGSWIRWCGCPD